jgi:hypothetical protein
MRRRSTREIRATELSSRPQAAELIAVSGDAQVEARCCSDAMTRPTPNFPAAPLPFSSRAAALGLVAGLASACVISIGDNWSKAQEACFEQFEDCMDDADSRHDADACEALLDDCLAACDDDSAGQSSSGDDGRSPSDDDDPSRADDDDGGGDGDGGDSDGDDGGDGDGDGPNPTCFAIHATCVAEAQTLQDIEACEELFDNCIDPGPCESEECEPGCPQAQLDACVDGYAECAAAAVSEQDVHACAAAFDGCIAEFDVSLCLPNYDDDLVAECLDQHDLCTDCAEDEDQLAACKTAFDNCLEG